MADTDHSGTNITGGHTNAVAGGAAGFMSGTDKTKLDGIEAAADVTDFANVSTALAAASSSISVNSQKITSLADPAAAQDAATQNFVNTLQIGTLQWGNNNANAATADRFMYPGYSSGAAPTNEAVSYFIAPTEWRLRNLYIRHDTTMTSDTVTYTVRVNGVDTSITCAVANNTTTNNDTAHTAAVSAGDRVSIKSVQSSTQTNTSLIPKAGLGYSKTS